jgi:Putative auto-transporter adhesin, head GIN domain
MKTLNLFIFSLTLTLIIIMSNLIDLQAQEVKGNGNVVKETRDVSSFDKIEVNGVMNVFLNQSGSESVVVESDQNLLSYIKTKVKGNILVIGTKEDIDIEKSTKLNVYVNLSNLTSLEMNGVGKVESQNQLKLSNLEINNNGVGNLKLDLDCDKLNAQINSVGSVTLTGNVNNAFIQHNGVGNLMAFDLSVDILKIESNAVGSAEVNAAREIYIDNNGVGNIIYKGSALLKSLNDNGIGKVKKL